MERRHVVVTGGAGFIGANLCRSLLQRGGYDITVIDDLSTGNEANLDDLDVDFRRATILDREAVVGAMTPGCAIVHLGALGSVPRSVADPVTSHEVNATGTLTMLEAARTVEATQFVLASSSSVYGDSTAPAKHEQLPVAPRSPYGASKLAAEAYTLAYHRTYGLNVLPFRFFNVFGPLQAAGHAYAAVVPSFVDRALRGLPLVVHGDGRQSRDFTFVETVCETIIDGLERNVCHDGPVNLAFGTQVPLLDIVDLISAELGKELELEHVEPRSGDIRHSKADASVLRSLFPSVEPVPIEIGIERTVRWSVGQPRHVEAGDHQNISSEPRSSDRSPVR